MTLSIELPAELAQRVAEEAARHGQEPADFARAALEEKVATPTQRKRNQQVIALLDQWEREDAAAGEDAGPAPVIPPLSLRNDTID
jgi:predicted transcriptional regulator